jgi:hypothetical protein
LNTRERDGILVGAGAGLTLIFLLVLQSFIGSGLLSTRTVTTTTTAAVSTIPSAYDQVASAYANHLLVLDSDNTSALIDGYASNATIEWTGDANGHDGNYTGGNLRILLIGFTEGFDNYSLSNETQAIGAKGGFWLVNSAFDVDGFGGPVGNINITIDAQDSYVHVGSSWLIARETWNFTRYQVQYYINAGF